MNRFNMNIELPDRVERLGAVEHCPDLTVFDQISVPGNRRRDRLVNRYNRYRCSQKKNPF